MNNNMNQKFTVAGVIVIKGDKTILVETPRGHLSFPKGKKEKGESDIQCAHRELFEETGIRAEMLKFVENLQIDEFTRKGFPSVRYFVGILEGEFNKFKFDTEELKSVKWYKIEDVLKMTDDRIRSERRQVLRDAVNKIETEK